MTRNRIYALAVALFLAAGALLSAQPEEKTAVRHTFIVRDGKVVEMDDLPMLGGKRTYLGVKFMDLSPELHEYFGVDRSNGVLVSSVESGSPAEKAGLKAGDVITAADGKPVENMLEFRQTVAKKHRGDALRLDVTRNKSKQSLVATLDERELGPLELLPGELLGPGKLEGLRILQGAPEWKGRVMTLGPDCNDLQGRIKELENRLKELEKKLQK